MPIKQKCLSIISKLLIRFVYPIKNLYYELFHRNLCFITASVWPFFRNWGDDISIVIASLINPRCKFLVTRYSMNIKQRNVYLCVGSILSWMTTPNSIVWGSGVVYLDKPLSAKPKKVLAVRGPISRKYLLDNGVDCPEIYGDPALLLPRFYKPPKEKKYRLGVIPHFRDKHSAVIGSLRDNPSVIVIDVQESRPWWRFIDLICSCDFICSSSLHGVIVADAYGIPNRWIELSNGERKRTAFIDYYQSVGKKDSEGFYVDNDTSVDELVSSCFQWKQNVIDLDLLLSVCPFK